MTSLARRLSDSDVDDIRAAHPVAEYAARYVGLRRAGADMVGPCPICGGGKLNGRFAIKPCGARWVCAVCQDGGDIIKLVRLVEGCDFRGAIEALGEGHLFALRGAESASERAAREAALAEAKARRAQERADAQAEQDKANEQQRLELYAIWQKLSQPVTAGSPPAQYLAGRNIDVNAALAAGLRLRWFSMTYSERDEKNKKWRTDGDFGKKHPVMLSAFQRESGHFSGLHVTYLRQPTRLPDSGYEKLEPVDMQTGEKFPSKKMRGIKRMASLRLIGPAAPHTLVLGEGIETVLSLFTALTRAKRSLDGWAFHAAGDLGNIGGRAMGVFDHPVLRQPNGRPTRVPDERPDMECAGAPVPDSVKVLILAGDGDSDPVLTEACMARAKARHGCEGREIRILMAPKGRDWNDVLRGIISQQAHQKERVA